MTENLKNSLASKNCNHIACTIIISDIKDGLTVHLVIRAGKVSKRNP